jgi:hypothetical protein
MHDEHAHERDELIARIASELRATPVGSGAAVKARIAAEVLRDGAPAAGRGRHRAGGGLAAAWRWLASPRAVRISPLGGLAAAAGLAAVAWALSTRTALPPHAGPVAQHSGAASVETMAAAPASIAGAEAPRVVQFVLVAPAARHVALVGDFNGWDPRSTPLHRASAGHGDVWAVELPLAPGRHAYAFVVDDSTWVADPGAARAPGDDFGAPSSVIVVGAGAT